MPRARDWIGYYGFLMISYWGLNTLTFVFYFFLIPNLDNSELLYLKITSVSAFWMVLPILIIKRKDIDQNRIFLKNRINSCANKILNTNILIFICLIIIYFLIFTKLGFSFSKLTSKTTLGGIESVLKFFSYTFATGLFLQCLSIKSTKYFFAVFLVSLFVAIVNFYILRTRSYVIVMLLPIVLSYFYLYPHRVKKFLTFSFKKSFAKLAVILVIFLSLGLRWIRGAMEYGNEMFQITSSQAIELYLLAGDIGYGISITKLIGILESSDFFLYGQSYYRIFFTPIPRAIWPDKPENSQQLVAEVIGQGPDFQTLPIGIQGDAYFNLGVFFFIAPFFISLIMRHMDNSKLNSLILFSPIAFVPCFHLARGGFTNPVILIFISILMIYFVYARRLRL